MREGRSRLLFASVLVALTIPVVSNLGCSESPTTGNPSTLVRFADPLSGFTTSDVRDANDEMLRFDSTGHLIWVATGQRFAGFAIDGNAITNGTAFQIRFGPPSAPQAYFTERGPATVCDVSVVGGELMIRPTTHAVPK